MADHLDTAIADNAAARSELLQAVDAIPGQRRLETAMGEWSVKDVVAHLIGWQDGYAAALEAAAGGERPSIPGYEDDDSYNARSVDAARGDSWEQVMGQLRTSRERYEAAIRGLRALPEDRWAAGRTLHRLSQMSTHEREHIAEILQWRQEQGL